jgi:hypothetical protein
MAYRKRTDVEKLFEKAAKKGFGAPAKIKENLQSKGGEKAAFFRTILKERGPMTKRELADAWLYRQGVKIREDEERVLNLVDGWIRRRVKAGELEQKGDSGDEYGSKLYGFREGWIP